MKKSTLFLMLLVTSASIAQTLEIDCVAKRKIIGEWYQDDLEFKEETIGKDGFSLHYSKPKTELKLNKDKTYSYKSIMILTFNVKEFNVYNAKAIIKIIGNGTWNIDCKSIIYKSLNKKISSDIDEDLKKHKELYNATLKLIEIHSKDSEIVEFELQEILDVSKEMILTNNKRYIRI